MKSAFQEAADLFHQYVAESDFYSALADHLHTGSVFATPNLFMMGKAVLLEDGRPAFFVSIGVGDLGELIGHVPRSLHFIAFRRRGETKIRVYPMERFCRLSSFGLYPTALC